ncbi:MAG: LysR family transcriptional regulator [Clostridiales Family XIII bacterium]|jgi:DNA-binding transcriptional LysR family regulator|nr:LysR family transcriptional regulator [Clostridiales Family XIII bacterium]
MLNNITLQQIVIFLTVAEQLNLSEAARELFLNQSAVSRWIQRLEESLGRKLFVRTNKGVELTDQGEFLYQELKPIYEELGLALSHMRNFYDAEDKIIRVGCIDSSEILQEMQKVVEGYESKNGDVIFKIDLVSFKDLLVQLTCGKLDVLFTYSVGFGRYRNVSVEAIADLETFIAISANNPHASGDDIPLDAMKNMPLFLTSTVEFGEAELRAIDICRELGFDPKDIKYTTSYYAFEMAVKNDMGFGICGKNICDHFGDQIKLYPLTDPKVVQHALIAWRTNNSSDVVNNFIRSCTSR